MNKQKNAALGHRIQWVDIAKGMAMLFVIIGHTAPFGSMERNFIFSFHMPLFFLLSGYTLKFTDSWEAAGRKAIRRAYQLLVPVFVIAAVSVFLSYHNALHRDVATLMGITKNMALAVLWGSGIPFKSHPGLGMCWFLISLFWADIILNGIHLCLSQKPVVRTFFIIILSGIGIALGKHGIWLPQNFDVTLCCILFLYTGVLWRTYDYVLKKHDRAIFIVGAVFWGLCLFYGKYIELASRHYPGAAWCVIEAIAAVYVICFICREFELSSLLNRAFTFIGINTLSIFEIHALDWYVKPVWDSANWKVASLKRLCIVLSITLLLLLAKYIWREVMGRRS